MKGGGSWSPKCFTPPAFLFINLSGLNKKVVSTIGQNALLQISIFISLLGPDEGGGGLLFLKMRYSKPPSLLAFQA